MLIRFDQILGPHGGDFDQKIKCPTYARGPPPPGLTLIDALILSSRTLSVFRSEQFTESVRSYEESLRP